MKKIRIVLITISLIYNSISVLGQSNKEFERIIKLSEATQDIDFYVYKHKDYDVQIELLNQNIGSKNPVVRKNCYIWFSFIGHNDLKYRPYVVELLVDGINDDDKYVVDACYSWMIKFFNKNDFTEKSISTVKNLFLKQKKSFYVLNTYVNTEDKREKDSCWTTYRNNPIYYDVTKLIGYLEIKELIPDFRQILKDFKGRWGYNYADYPLMDNPIENYAESRIINPWNIHLALAHMGDTSEIKYCISQFDLVVERNKNKPDIIFNPFMKEMVYIMQPQIMPVFKNILQLSEVDEYYVDYSNRCFRNLIKDFPTIGAEKDVVKEILDWLNTNQNNIELNRLEALTWDSTY